MKLIRNALAAGIAVAAISLGACSNEHGSTGTSGSNGGGSIGTINGNPGEGNLGSVGMHLSISAGVNVFALNWTISNGTNSYPGTVNIGDAQSIEFVAGGIVAGTGYIVTLSGSDSAGDPCTGASAAVTVVAGATSSATVVVTCTAPTDAAVAADVGTGSIAVDAGVVLVGQAPFQCPGINSLAISPSEVLPPQTAALTSTTTPFSGGTETILWTTSCAGANFTAPTALSTTFNCGSESGVLCTVTLTVGLDGNAADGGPTTNQVCTGAYTTMSETINCEVGTLACFAPTPNGCPVASPTTCVSFANDVNNCGGCGNVCAAGDVCTSGVCTAPPPTPCTTAPCAASGSNSVQCTGSTGGVCTPTEALIVTEDIAQSKVTGSTLNAATSCYLCLESNGGLDDTGGDHGNECGDVTGSVTLTGETGTQACLDTLGCMITNSCDTASPPSLCLCGSAAGSACLTAGAANGNCLQNEINGLDIGTGTTLGSLVEGDPTATQKAYTNKALGSGMANAIGAFAFSNCATQCGSNL
ncbi:MAG: hypothetical protein ACLP1X_03345 [Polyangiaceae bacterium]